MELTPVVSSTPITNVEELKFDIIAQMEGLDRKDNVIFIIDSVGNLASKKELEDAMNEKSVADMSRAKALKGLFRMTTPYLNMKNIPLIAINHTYKEIGLFPKDVVSGGTGIYYSADNIWILGRRQNKTGTEVTGYDFIINVEKSRYVKEKSKFLSLCLGMVGLSIGLVFLILLWLVNMLLSLVTGGIVGLIGILANSWNQRFERSRPVRKSSGNPS